MRDTNLQVRKIIVRVLEKKPANHELHLVLISTLDLPMPAANPAYINVAFHTFRFSL